MIQAGRAIPVGRKPRLLMEDRLWVCVGLLSSGTGWFWKRAQQPTISYGLTPMEAYTNWKFRPAYRGPLPPEA